MERRVTPELLDELPPADPRALRSRKDLVRVNAWMGNCRIMARELHAARNDGESARLLDLGAGDGRFLLGVARRLPAGWRGTRALLLDRLADVGEETRRGFAEVGWRAESLHAEAVDWLERTTAPSFRVIVANLFLHHLDEDRLGRLFRAAAKKTDTFIALEPRRSRPGTIVSRWLGLIGCSAVTRHDARVSVQAGFIGGELSRLWPDCAAWSLQERRAGRFSHLFLARRKEKS